MQGSLKERALLVISLSIVYHLSAIYQLFNSYGPALVSKRIAIDKGLVPFKMLPVMCFMRT